MSIANPPTVRGNIDNGTKKDNGTTQPTESTIAQQKHISKEIIIENVLKKYQDLEIMIDVWTLGLIYDVTVNGNDVKLRMTFTSPMCPYGPMMVEEIKELIIKEGAHKAEIEITFDPPWKPSDELRQLLGV